MVMFFLWAIDLIFFAVSPESASTIVPVASGSNVLQTRTGILVIDRRLDRFWMQDLRTKICELGGLFVRQNGYRPAPRRRSAGRMSSRR